MWNARQVGVAVGEGGAVAVAAVVRSLRGERVEQLLVRRCRCLLLYKTQLAVFL